MNNPSFMNKNFLLAVFLLAGTIIGAGIFSLPYIFSRSGLVSGFFYLVAFVTVYCAIHWMYARILVAEDGSHQFFYLARRYFSKPIAFVASLSILFELLFVMLVYLVLAPVFIGVVFDGTSFTNLVFFWVISSIFIFARVSWMGYADILGTVSILGIIALVFFSGNNGALEIPLVRQMDLKLFFLPFGPLLFSLAGRPAIHKVMEEHKKAIAADKKFSLKKAVVLGTIIPALVYAFFVISVLRLNPSPLPEALNSLSFLSPTTLALLGIMGLITLWTSYFMIGVNVKDILRLDLKYPVWLSVLAVLFIPPLLYFAGFREFLFVLSFSGGVLLALEAFFVVLMWRRAFPTSRWRWISLPIFLIFILAIAHEIFSLFKLV